MNNLSFLNFFLKVLLRVFGFLDPVVKPRDDGAKRVNRAKRVDRVWRSMHSMQIFKVSAASEVVSRVRAC